MGLTHIQTPGGEITTLVVGDMVVVGGTLTVQQLQEMDQQRKPDHYEVDGTPKEEYINCFVIEAALGGVELPANTD
jgi:hypothetical protein